MIGLIAVIVPTRALELTVGLILLAVMITDLAWGVVLFSGLVFIEALPGVGSGVSVIKLAGLLLVASWLFAHATKREKPSSLLKEQPFLAWCTIGFFALTLASSLWASSSGTALSSAAREGQGILLFFIVYSALQTVSQLRAAMLGYVTGASLTALIGVGGSTGSDSTDAVGRFAGSIGDPNYFAALLVPALAFASFMLLGKLSTPRRVLLGAGAVACAAALFLTASRGGIVALGAMTIGVIFFAGPLRSRVIGFIACVIGLGIVYFALYAPPEAMAHLTAFGAGGSSGRTDLWSIGLQIFNAHPLLGVGAGNFILVEPTYALSNIPLASTVIVFDTPHVAHNTYLQILTELGALGLAVFGAMVLATFRLAFQAVRIAVESGDRELEILVRALLIAFIGLSAAYVFLTAEYEKQLWLMFGLVAAGWSVARRSSLSAEEAS